MSEYTTEELVNWVKIVSFGCDESSPSFAIIAKLRAADKLCKIAKIAIKDFKHINGLLKSKGFHPYTLTPKDLAEAIVEYEGKK